tara:strand:+ start:224 stop:355 length:132 start_codon:yes stop_codon:yes gene_type:complete
MNMQAITRKRQQVVTLQSGSMKEERIGMMPRPVCKEQEQEHGV